MARRAYIDWLRGLAVVVMILAHTSDSWTRLADRSTRAYDLVVKISGMAAPLFLFLAGVSVVLAAGGKARRTGDVAAAAAAVRRRGWQIFGLAFLFRLQAMVIGWGRLAGLLKVDILNVMGPSMVGAAALWGVSTRPRVRIALLALAACAFSLLSPIIRGWSWLGVLPDPLEWYFRPPPGRSWFTFFPWAGLLLAGAVIGVVIDSTRNDAQEARANRWLLVGGAALIVTALVGSRYPSLYAHSSFWTTSPSYFFLRIGLMSAMIGAAYFLARWWPPRPSSAMLEFGHSSLFVYWIHVELVYSWISYPLRKSLPLGWALAAFALFTWAMLWISRKKTAFVSRRAQRRAGYRPV